MTPPPDVSAPADVRPAAPMPGGPAPAEATPVPEVAESSSAESSAERPSAPRCDDCGAPLVGPYCAMCGQDAAERVRPLHEMARELVDGLLGLDLRLARTLPLLLRRPGPCGACTGKAASRRSPNSGC
jgi:hypothetical protein